MISYLNGRFGATEDLRISPEDRGFLFGDGVYEVICSYGGRLFMAREHMLRLRNSLHEMRIDVPDVDDLVNVGLELLERNSMESSFSMLYFQVSRGVGPRRHSFPDLGTPPTVYANVSPYHLPLEMWDSGVSAILQPDLRWARCDIKTTALVPNILANQRAAEAGAYEAFLVREGFVTEGTHTSIGAILEGRLWTHPLTQHVLPGITRAVVLGLCRELGIQAREQAVPLDRLREASELMLFATSVAITPVVRLDGHPVGDGTPGPVARRLLAAFRRMAGV